MLNSSLKHKNKAGCSVKSLNFKTVTFFEDLVVKIMTFYL